MSFLIITKDTRLLVVAHLFFSFNTCDCAANIVDDVQWLQQFLYQRYSPLSYSFLIFLFHMELISRRYSQEPSDDF